MRAVVATHALRDRRHALVATAVVALSNVLFEHAEAEPTLPWWR